MRSSLRTWRRVLAASAAATVVVLVAEAAIAAHGDYIAGVDFHVDLTIAGSAPALRMAVLGDSTVAGLGATGARESLAGQIAAKVGESTGRAVSVTGFGVSGATTQDVLRSQLRSIGGDRFDVIVVEVGSNDVTHLTRLATLEQQTRELLVRARRCAPVVVLGSAGRLNSPNFLPPLRQLVMARATSIRARQSDVARDLGVPIVDVARDVSPTYDRTSGATSRDQFHPSDVGYEIWARPLAQRVVEALGQDAASRGART